MSRYGGARHSSADLAYGDEPGPSNRWDRDRFERFRRGPEQEQRETIRISERDTPRRTEVRIEERERDVGRRGPARGRDEREFDFLEEERYGPPARIPRRSDRDLFGDLDPRDVVERQQQLAPYRRKSIIEREIEIDRRGPERRPGLMRRQSSLDTFDRRPVRREHEEYRLPPNVPIPLPSRRRSPSRNTRGGDYEEFEDIRYRDYSPHGYRDMEIMREKTRVRKRDRRRSDLRSVSGRSSSTESFEEISRAGSPSPERKVGKKGKTRMPKRLVRREAIVQLGYPFEEEDDFIIVRRALEKDQIDEVIRISENYKTPKTTTYRYEENVRDMGMPMPPPPPPAPADHYEALRTEWINPPSVRAPSPARSQRTRRSSPARTTRAPSPPAPIYIQQPAPPPQRETVYIQQPAPPPPRETVYIQQPSPPPPRETVYVHQHSPQPPIPVHAPQQPMTIVLPERHRHSDRDIKAEIRALEAEQRALRYERNMQITHRPDDAYEVVEFRERKPDRHGGELVEYVERRDRSPKRETVRVEKDRKEKKVNPKLVAAMMATLT